jgi:hypothetical protein
MGATTTRRKKTGTGRQATFQSRMLQKPPYFTMSSTLIPAGSSDQPAFPPGFYTFHLALRHNFLATVRLT